MYFGQRNSLTINKILESLFLSNDVIKNKYLFFDLISNVKEQVRHFENHKWRSYFLNVTKKRYEHNAMFIA